MAISKLKMFRELNDYTQEFVAEDILQISQNTYSKLERNPGTLTADQAQKLAELYNIGVADLLSDATPIITFKDSLKSNSNSANGYFRQQINQYNESEVASLKEEIKYLRQQNMELLKLIGNDRKSGDK